MFATSILRISRDQAAVDHDGEDGCGGSWMWEVESSIRQME
jgi:hypothetical protein